MAVSVFAQDYEKVAPKEPEKPEIITEAQEVAPKVETKILEDDTEVKIKSLNALVFLEKLEDIKTQNVEELRGIYAEKLPLMQTEAFSEKMKEFIRQPVSIQTLNRLTQVIADFYRENDRVLVRISLPEQNITSGVIQFVVTEGRLGDVKVTGNEWIDEENIRENIRLKEGEIIRSSMLESDMIWLNRNPFYQVEPIYAPGKTIGLTNLDMRVRDRFPVRFYGGYEDTGGDLTGDERWFTGFNWNTPLDHQINYQFTTSSDLSMFTAHAGNYSIPLPWRHIWNTFGSYNEIDADVRAPLDMEGKSWNAGTRYIIPFPRIFLDEKLIFTSEAQVGFDFKQSNNNLEFGGTPFTNNLTDVAEWIFNYNFSLRDEWGLNEAGTSIFYSPGAWTDNAKDPKYQTSRAFAEAEFVYGKVNFARHTRLPFDFSLHDSFTWQWSNGNLLASEQMSFGGYGTVRGYEEGEVQGDEGWLMRHELHTPPMSFGELFDFKDFNDQFIILGFWDYGVADNNRLLAGENADIELSSVGPGLRYNIGSYFSVRSDYGFQLLNTGNGNRFASRFHLGVTLSY